MLYRLWLSVPQPYPSRLHPSICLIFNSFPQGKRITESNGAKRSCRAGAYVTHPSLHTTTTAYSSSSVVRVLVLEGKTELARGKMPHVNGLADVRSRKTAVQTGEAKRKEYTIHRLPKGEDGNSHPLPTEYAPNKKHTIQQGM